MTEVLINGEPGDAVNAADRGLHYGDGLFETMRVRKGALPLWQGHWRRLSAGCARLGIEGIEEAALRDEAEQVAKGMTRGIVKIILTRGAGGRGYRPWAGTAATRIVAAYAGPDHPAAYWRDGVAVCICHTRLGRNPALAGMKHLNRLEQVLARREWDDPGIAEGLMLDDRDRVVCGTMTNLFVVQYGRLATPPVDQCGVAGVMRARLLEAVAGEERPLSLKDLEAADEILLCNAVIGIWPVRRIEDKDYKVGETTMRLMNRLRADGLLD